MDGIELSKYRGIKEELKTELKRVVESFVIIGYNLKQIRDEKLYKIDGYQNIHEFAKAEYGLSQSYTSRFIAINEKFSVNGSSPKLLEQYENIGYSKLSEMLNLSDNVIGLISVHTTKAEIIDIKRAQKEAESQIYAPVHNSESLENTQSEATFSDENKWYIPDAEKLLIGFFRPNTNREVMKELAILFKNSPNFNDFVEKASEVINPSGHLMFKLIPVILMFEEKLIKYNSFGKPTVDYTYNDFFSDMIQIFDLSFPDPWVAYYGEPELNSVPEPETPKIDAAKPEAKRPEPLKKPKAKAPARPERDEYHRSEVKEDNNLPGQHQIENYPELFPEDQEVDNLADDGQNESESNVEIVEADIVQTTKSQTCLEYEEDSRELRLLISKDTDIRSIKMIDTDTGESWEITNYRKIYSKLTEDAKLLVEKENEQNLTVNESNIKVTLQLAICILQDLISLVEEVS